jgi:ATP-dependent Clp protease ATP-binding subunit ClpC
MFGDSNSIIQVDMSEYMEKFSVSRMIGSPPGYVGHEEGGQLSEQVRRKPYSVVLFDEIEKAHPDVVQIMLQIFEEGRLTDSLGREIDFRNTIIIMTTNVGAAAIQRQTKMGFGAAKSLGNDYESIKENVTEEAKKTFKPEFLNRINDLIVFHSLEREHLFKIVDLEIAKVQSRLIEKKISIELTKDAKELIIDTGYDEKYGARPLRRAIEQLLEDPLAEALLGGEINEEDCVAIDRDGDKLTFTSKEKAEATASESESS